MCSGVVGDGAWLFLSQVMTERKVLEVHITKGMRNGQKITFHGEADEAPGLAPGDIIFIVEEKVFDLMCLMRPAPLPPTLYHK